MIAVVILTDGFWMRKVSRNVKVQLEQAVDSALQRGNHHGWALVMMVFCRCKGRAGVGLFLLAAFQQDVGIWPPLGAMLGLATAVVLGFLLYWGGIRLNLGAFLNGPVCLFSSSPQGWQLVPFAHFMKPDCGTTFRKSPSI